VRLSGLEIKCNKSEIVAVETLPPLRVPKTKQTTADFHAHEKLDLILSTSIFGKFEFCYFVPLHFHIVNLIKLPIYQRRKRVCSFDAVRKYQ